jgi:hypothetical protein
MSPIQRDVGVFSISLVPGNGAWAKKRAEPPKGSVSLDEASDLLALLDELIALALAAKDGLAECDGSMSLCVPHDVSLESRQSVDDLDEAVIVIVEALGLLGIAGIAECSPQNVEHLGSFAVAV